MQMETKITLKIPTYRLFCIWRRNRGGTLFLSFILFVKVQCSASQVSLEHFIQLKANSTLLHPALVSLKTVSIFPL